jgi:hypothetical protein
VVEFIPQYSVGLEHFFKDMSEMGTSIQLGEGDGKVPLHIMSTEKRYEPIDYTLTWNRTNVASKI